MGSLRNGCTRESLYLEVCSVKIVYHESIGLYGGLVTRFLTCMAYSIGDEMLMCMLFRSVIKYTWRGIDQGG